MNPYLPYTIRTANLTKDRFSDVVLNLLENIANVKNKIIQGQSVDLYLEFKVARGIVWRQKDILQCLVGLAEDEVVYGQLQIHTNRYLFDWFCQNMTDRGAMYQKYVEIEPGVYDGERLRANEPEPEPKKAESSTVWNDVLDFGSKLVVPALVVGITTLIAKRAIDTITEEAAEAIRETSDKIVAPSIEIYVNEYGYFEDVEIDTGYP